MKKREIHRMLERASAEVTDGALTRDAAFAVVAELESRTYELAVGMIGFETTHGATRESGRTRAMPGAMDERHHWLQQSHTDVTSDA